MNNLNSVVCGNVTYYNRDENFIGIEYISNPIIEVVEEEKHIQQNLTIKPSVLERYKKLCDSGLPKFCLVVEQNKEKEYITYWDINTTSFFNTTEIMDIQKYKNLTEEIIK